MDRVGTQRRAESAQERRDTSVKNEEGRAYGHRGLHVGRKEVILTKSEYKDMNCVLQRQRKEMGIFEHLQNTTALLKNTDRCKTALPTLTVCARGYRFNLHCGKCLHVLAAVMPSSLP